MKSKFSSMIHTIHIQSLLYKQSLMLANGFKPSSAEPLRSMHLFFKVLQKGNYAAISIQIPCEDR